MIFPLVLFLLLIDFVRPIYLPAYVWCSADDLSITTFHMLTKRTHIPHFKSINIAIIMARTIKVHHFQLTHFDYRIINNIIHTIRICRISSNHHKSKYKIEKEIKNTEHFFNEFFFCFFSLFSGELNSSVDIDQWMEWRWNSK